MEGISLFFFKSLHSITFWVRVRVTLKGASGIEVKANPRHKKNAEIGMKDTVYGPIVYIEQEDAVSFEDNEEVCSPTRLFGREES